MELGGVGEIVFREVETAQGRQFGNSGDELVDLSCDLLIRCVTKHIETAK